MINRLHLSVLNLKTYCSKNTILSFHLILFFFISSYTFGQGPGSLFIDAGPDVVIDCGSTGCADLTATFLETFETSSATYTIDSIDYVPPFAFNGLANSLNTSIDDAWSNVDTLPFDFCFFGNLEQEFQVGSNGVIRFDVDPGDVGSGSNGWSFSENLPNSTNSTLSEANVFTPVHDIDPSAGSGLEEIGYEVLGEYPNRVLVVSYFDVPMFSGGCNALLATHMAVFYEFSNVIEIYIQDKPSCPTWNSGNAALGIQNNEGTVAYVPPGRNTSDSPWTATNEAWRFAPDGVETYAFEWLDASGTVIGTDPTINVCPPGGSGTYTARISYTNTCNGDLVVLTDEVVVTPSQPSITAPNNLNIDPDPSSCVAVNVDLGTPTVTGCEIQTISNDAPTEFPLGITQVIWTVVDENGFASTDTQTVTVTLQVDVAEICYITSDEVEVTKNRVFLYNLDGLNVDNYEIRRETSTGGVYETVGFIVPPENSFLDNSSNNNSQTYRYLINTTDICGATSPDSDYHKTILLQSSVATDNSVNLSWNPYIGISLSTYNIFRRVNNGSYELLISLPSTSLTYNDTEADVLSNDYGYYVSIDVANCTGIPFNPIALKSNRQIIGNLIVNDWDELEQSIILFPNPSSLVVTVKLPNELMLKEVMILNNLGQVISKYDTSTFDTEFLASGLYYLQIVTDKGTFNKSLIKE